MKVEMEFQLNHSASDNRLQLFPDLKQKNHMRQTVNLATWSQ